MTNLTDKQKGVWALIAYTFLGNIMAIWVRILGEHFEVLQQIMLRALAGGLIGFAIFNKQVNFKKVLRYGAKGYPLILFRSILLISGIILFTNALLITKLSNIGFIFGLPTTALLGVIILKEKLTIRRFGLILLSFLGVMVISIKDFNNIFDWGLGEVLILISTFFYAGANIVRKFLPKEISNQELSTIGAIFVSVLAFILSYYLYHDFGLEAMLDINLTLMVILAGITFVTLGVLGGIGFEKLEAVVANNLLTLEVVFGIIVGFLAFGEVPVIREILGGVLILVSAYLINREKES